MSMFEKGAHDPNQIEYPGPNGFKAVMERYGDTLFAYAPTPPVAMHTSRPYLTYSFPTNSHSSPTVCTARAPS